MDGNFESDMPPADLTPEELAEWWRNKLRGEQPMIDAGHPQEGWTRVCPYCEAHNPCSGNATCIQCNNSLKGA